MKKYFLITVLFLSVVTIAEAQRGNGQRPSQSGGGQHPQINPEQMMERQIQRLDEAVKLTDAQKVKVKEIFKKNGEKQREMFQSMRNSGTEPTEADREKMRAQRDEFRKKQDAEIKALLTGDQVAKYETYLKEREARMKERMNNRGADAPNR